MSRKVRVLAIKSGSSLRWLDSSWDVIFLRLLFGCKNDDENPSFEFAESWESRFAESVCLILAIVSCTCSSRFNNITQREEPKSLPSDSALISLRVWEKTHSAHTRESNTRRMIQHKHIIIYPPPPTFISATRNTTQNTTRNTTRNTMPDPTPKTAVPLLLSLFYSTFPFFFPTPFFFFLWRSLWTGYVSTMYCVSNLF